MGRFDGLNAAPSTQRGEFFSGEGKYDTTIQNVMWKESEQHGPMVIVELIVDRSTNPEHPAGCRRTYIQKMAKKTIAFSALKGFVRAVARMSHLPESELKVKIDPHCETYLDQACENGKFNGKKVGLRTKQVTTKAGHPFTRLDWVNTGTYDTELTAAEAAAIA